MTGFRFRLQTVLDLRERKELESAKGLVDARSEADMARKARKDLEAVREAGRTLLTDAHGSGGTVGHLQNMAYVLGRVDQKIEDAHAVCQQADEHVVDKVKSYHVAFQHRKTIDRLKERKFDQWRSAEIKHERKTMDEVALTRHGRDDLGVLGDLDGKGI